MLDALYALRPTSKRVLYDQAQTRRKVAEANLNMEPLNILKEVGRLWQNISDYDLSFYKKEAARDRLRFKAERKAYFKAHDTKKKEEEDKQRRQEEERRR